ncbi:MAG TPA: hypothetical protein VIU61_18405 [Kofleriaceae bacterium]
MPIHLARHLALAACLTLLGSAADAEANRRGRSRKIAKAKYDVSLVDRDNGDDDDNDDKANDDRDGNKRKPDKKLKNGKNGGDEDNDEDKEKAGDNGERKKTDNTRRRSYDADNASDDDDDDDDDDEDDDDDDDDDEDEADDDDEVDDADEADDADDDGRKARKRARSRRKVVAAESDAELDLPSKIRKRAAKTGMRDWNFSIGPNVWMASVDANVAVGDKSVGTAIDFFQLSRHTRYGVPILAEARYRRFSLVADMLYGVIDVAGQNEVGPIMLSLQGTVKSLQVDGIAGFRVLGNDASRIALDARAGIRYQRTAITGSVDLGGSGFSPKAIIDAGSDGLVGARVVVRPFKRFSLEGTVDQSVVGSSTSTWSAGAELNVRIISRVVLAVGWKTLTQQRAAISTVMHGPRAAVQLLF